MSIPCPSCGADTDAVGRCSTCHGKPDRTITQQQVKALAPTETAPYQPADGYGKHGRPTDNHTSGGQNPLTATPEPLGPHSPDDETRLNSLLVAIAGQSHFEERYKVLGELSRGGMGSVSHAFDRVLRRDVAIKRMLRSESAPARGQFLKEARVGGRLLHPNILAVFDLGVDRSGQLYYTMRLVNGASLQSSLAALELGVNTKLVSYPLRKLVAAFLGVCRGVDYGHQNRVLHLDLKPSNVLMSGFEEVFVIDWGLARVDDVDDTEQLIDLYRQARDEFPAHRADQTFAVGRIAGTPAYMTPEQARGDVAGFGPATDVYGLGGILHYILYDKPPNAVGNVGSVAHALQALAAATRHGPKLPLRTGILPRGRRVKPAVGEAVAALEAIALKALEPDPAKRYPTADELVCELEEWLTAAPV